jgi:hypothetical protein
MSETLYKIVNGEQIELSAEEVAEFNASKDLPIDNSIRFRNEREQLLRETDHWAYQDTPEMTEEQIAYRQALRDIPNQETWPESVTWPTKPE